MPAGKVPKTIFWTPKTEKRPKTVPKVGQKLGKLDLFGPPNFFSAFLGARLLKRGPKKSQKWGKKLVNRTFLHTKKPEKRQKKKKGQQQIEILSVSYLFLDPFWPFLALFSAFWGPKRSSLPIFRSSLPTHPRDPTAETFSEFWGFDRNWP